jgi:molecular chaperone GrpE (heat shock protein)
MAKRKAEREVEEWRDKASRLEKEVEKIKSRYERAGSAGVSASQ